MLDKDVSVPGALLNNQIQPTSFVSRQAKSHKMLRILHPKTVEATFDKSDSEKHFNIGAVDFRLRMLGTPNSSHKAIVKKVEKVDQFMQHLSFKEKAQYAAVN